MILLRGQITARISLIKAERFCYIFISGITIEDKIEKKSAPPLAHVFDDLKPDVRPWLSAKYCFFGPTEQRNGNV
jgi:hypothetical protein